MASNASLGLKALIFKAEDESGSSIDSYSFELDKLGITASVIPALKFEYYNLEELQVKLSRPEVFSGVIFSSPRCVSAVEKCGGLLNWKTHKIFCVGTKTGSLVRNMGADPLGEDSGNASALADFILKSYSNLEKPLLLPHGNLSLKILTNSLTNGGMKVECVEVYHTLLNPSLKDLLNEYFKNYQRVDLIIFMSPSAVNASLPILRELQDLSTIKFVTLGPTTAQCLESNGIPLAGVAEKPSPQHLAAAVSNIISVDGVS